MDKLERKKKRSSKRKRKSESYSILHHADAQTISVVMLAAISNSHKPSSNSLVKKCLNKLRLSLLSKPPNLPFSSQQTLLYPILSLLPVLVKSKCAGIASVGAEIVGAASLLSFEMNDLIASDCEIVRALVSALASSKRRISSAACNAMLDLSTTSVGRQRLLEFSAVENLMFGFLQVSKSSTTFVSLCNVDKGSDFCLRIVFEEDDLPALILDAVLILINTCNNEQLEKIPRRLTQTFLVYLKELWAKVRSQMLPGHTLKFIRERHFYSTNVGINNLAESIFRLSIIAGQLTTPFPYEVVKRNIFGLNESSFENFILNHWEISPFLISKHSNVLNEQDDMFSSFVQFLNSKGTVISILSSILKSLVSCPPIASDELDILGFLKKVENKLGCSIVYQQDVRVVRTEKCLKREVHFFPDISDSYIKSPYVFNIDDILKCEEAYKEGYTIALRGMEFRFESISAIADGLASLFGQPSVGANLYLTPPNSQGLACHCDDHCVFVCQLLGSKQWKIFAQPIVRLPHLYEPLDSLHGSEVESPMAECRQLLLREGDVLYIPRGFPHEACTVADDGEPNGSTGFSLHLTFGIEVEPLFEWEGFAHVALNCWNRNQKQFHTASVDSMAKILNVMSVNLLHVVIRNIGDSDPTFRKACLAAAIPLLSDTNGWLDVNQKNIFSHLINRINTESRFSEALNSVEVAIQKNEDPFPWMRWLQLLNPEEHIRGYDFDNTMIGRENLSFCYDHKGEAEAAFVQVKSEFCSEVVFEDVTECHKVLLEKYKKARKQYMNGMLALHCH